MIPISLISSVNLPIYGIRYKLPLAVYPEIASFKRGA